MFREDVECAANKLRTPQEKFTEEFAESIRDDGSCDSTQSAANQEIGGFGPRAFRCLTDHDMVMIAVLKDGHRPLCIDVDRSSHPANVVHEQLCPGFFPSLTTPAILSYTRFRLLSNVLRRVSVSSYLLFR